MRHTLRWDACRLAAGALLVMGTLLAWLVPKGLSVKVGDRLLGATPSCVLSHVGLRCPFCGMTRALVYQGRGDCVAARKAHPYWEFVLAGHGIIGLVLLVPRSWSRRKSR